jgi:hypothetical protein
MIPDNFDVNGAKVANMNEGRGVQREKIHTHTQMALASHLK